ANAHVVIEEYVAPAPVPADGPALVVLSARDEERLRERVHQLVDHLAVLPDTVTLHDLAYTLQVGREAMDERLGLLVQSLDQLRDALAAWLDGEPVSTEWHRGRAGHDAIAELDDEAIGAAVDTWIAKGRYGKLLALWTKGLSLDWQRLHGDAIRRRVSLPTYPFAKERYWLPVTDTMAAAPAAWHPLLHRNTSTLATQRFSSRFDGGEWFFADHRVHGARVLPAAAQLEMAYRAAVEALEHEGALTLTDLAWTRPVIAGDAPLDLHVTLGPDEAGTMRIEIRGDDLHSEGRLRPIADEPVSHDLAALKAACDVARMDGATCRRRFEAMGIAYGRGFHALDAVAVGRGTALARIAAPATVRLGGYTLHPSLVDAAMQATVGAMDDDGQAWVPASLGALTVHRACEPSMWAVLRWADDGATRAFDIDLCDDDGVACVSLRALALRPWTAPSGPRPATTTVLLATPTWRAEAAAAHGTPPERQHVMLCGIDPVGLPHATHVPLVHDLAAAYGTAAASLLTWLQASGPALVQVVVPDRGPGEAFAGLMGMLRTAALENPAVIGQLIRVGAADDVASIVADNRAAPSACLRYVDGQRYVGAWSEVAASPTPPMPWKPGGVYLITGGAGGLGRLVARDIARRAPGAVLVLTGRSPLDAAIHETLAELHALGATARYRPLDVGDRAAVLACVRDTADAFGLSGIVHSAGVLRDGFLLRKSQDDLAAVLRAKVAGTVYLDEASRDLPLDAFVCFSSLAATRGNVGQADYAAANGFMDAFAHHRARRVAQGERYGQTLSVNWPLWDEGGMRVDDATRRYLAREIGMTPLRSDVGLDALAQALTLGASQVLVAEGDLTALRQSLLGAPTPAPVTAVAPAAPRPTPMPDDLRERTVRHLVALLAGTLKLPPERIDPNARLEAYGIDSVMTLDLTARLEETFGPLPKTLFFEYQSVAALAGYVMQAHRAALATLFGTSPSPSPLPQPVPSRVTMARHASRLATRSAPVADEGIAIIGLAGRYPQAENLAQFWANLSAGRDSITEIPGDRWDHTLYFDADRNAPGKTYSKWGGFLDGVDRFDPRFFNISPREAELMDPQERLFLECVHATLEDAGYTRENVAEDGNVGVFAGVMYEEYQLYGAQQQALGDAIAAPGSPASIANRVSYVCDFHGPSMALDTMCSSSLTAIHLACESLARGGCAVAIAGGVNVSIHPNKYLVLAQGRFISAKGRCESFGEGGEGYVPGEGVGAVLLKPLAQAQADGDHIYGVIRGTAINHGGKTNGYTVPNPNAQAKVVERALRGAGVDARQVSYIEAHGTGTSLGDPIEIAGLSKAFAGWTTDTGFCAIGSAKSNIGHCESAAGIAGVTKVLL
ncbi:SDR family NAD(P)-dependent oxidoreductase, partial [Luteibacter sp. PPL552]